MRKRRLREAESPRQEEGEVTLPRAARPGPLNEESCHE